MSLELRPVITATLEHRKASSDCCAAKLAPGAGDGTFLCTGCGQPCGRVLGPPTVVTAHG